MQCWTSWVPLLSPYAASDALWPDWAPKKGSGSTEKMCPVMRTKIENVTWKKINVQLIVQLSSVFRGIVPRMELQHPAFGYQTNDTVNICGLGFALVSFPPGQRQCWALWLLTEKEENHRCVLQAIKAALCRTGEVCSVPQCSQELTAQAGTDPSAAFPFAQPYLLCGSAFSFNKQTLKPFSWG